MSKSKVSDKFAQFETRNDHKLADARKEEKQSYGNPLPIGFIGTAVVSDAKADTSKAGDNYGVVEVTIVNDPTHDGKKVTGAYRMMKDYPNMTAIECYQSFLDDLEDMGLSRETREKSTLAGCFDELLASPHYVSITVTANPKAKDGKAVKCYAIASPDASGRTAEDTPTAPSPEETPDLPQGIYLGKPHYLEGTNPDGTLNLISVGTGKARPNVPANAFELAE